ncbi:MULTISPECIES: hypothetical protein [Nitrospirillum]|uniref:Uncharacterized protein n=1 Tax=Nitrospirillum amazonense TaxID=28077 RepID=A0A560FZ51_9PROT|nr:hypothetical protein [Nitrospirillum amazonense]MEC4592405.1 hypothetical protein [Nitrospirillum amazonense]TWB26917.1 hypothetical protein FBZ88_10783 [Nitrospirillum amazonense]
MRWRLVVGMMLATPALAGGPPWESRLTREADYTCFRALRGAMATLPPSPAPLSPGTVRVAGTPAAWQALWWDAKGGGAGVTPPADLPEGFEAVAIAMAGNGRTHVHIRDLEDQDGTLRIRVQREERKAPVHIDPATGQRSVVSVTDDGRVETLVIFHPATRAISLTVLPDLVWTPATDEEASAPPPCPGR